MSLDNILTKIAVVQRTVSGVKQAHDKIPDSINEFPCFVNFPSYETAPSERLTLNTNRHTTHKIQMCLYVTKADRISAEALLRPFLELVFSAFDADYDIQGSCFYSNITGYKYFVSTEWSVPYLGIAFYIDVHEGDDTNFIP